MFLEFILVEFFEFILKFFWVYFICIHKYIKKLLFPTLEKVNICDC
jgi:hypothetical protein